MSFYRYKVSKKKAKEFHDKMEEINQFCLENGIETSRDNDSYYFTLNGQKYRVSNHTIEKSNQGAFDSLGNQTRELYHNETREADIFYIHASKTRIIEIYNRIKQGIEIDHKGYRK